MDIQPYSVHVADDVLDDLKYRLRRSRLPDEIEDAGWDYGSNLQHHIQEINISNVTAVVHPPSLILQWDDSTSTLQRMSVMVCD